MEHTERGGLAPRPPIVVISADRERLLALLRESTLEVATGRFLREELERADIAPPDAALAMVVSMGSEVKFIDHVEQRVRSGRLVYPDEATSRHCISVLSPIGSALIGLGPGQSICLLDSGIERKFTVLEVRRPPE